MVGVAGKEGDGRKVNVKLKTPCRRIGTAAWMARKV